MTSATADTPEVEKDPTARDRVIDACRRVAHVSHEARPLKSLAADAVDDGVHAAKRAMTSVRRAVEELGDLRDEAAHRVKSQPLKVVGIALGIGLVLGLVVGWIGRGSGRRE